MARLPSLTYAPVNNNRLLAAVVDDEEAVRNLSQLPSQSLAINWAKVYATKPGVRTRKRD